MPATLLRECDGKALYAYRGHEFTIVQTRLAWWCHSGISIPADPGAPFGGKWSLVSICHEAGWGTVGPRGRHRILRKLCRAVDERIRHDTRDRALAGKQIDLREAARHGLAR